jgi:hypothetical protein
MKKVVIGVCMNLVALMLATVTAHAQAGPLDHMICYKIQDALKLQLTTVNMIAELQPEFSQRECTLKKAVEFCVPAEKMNVVPAASEVNPNIIGQPLANDYVCYQARCAKDVAPPSKLVADQFGRRTLKKFKAQKICVPAKKHPIECGFLGTTSQCGGLCPNATDICQINATGDACTCETQSGCTGSPDKAGACGGTCTDPAQKCLPDYDAVTGAGTTCKCKDPLSPLCGLNAATGQCGGNCLNLADKCVMNTAGDCTCEHVDPPCVNTAAAGAAPVCGGWCPPASPNCDPDSTNGGCSCQPYQDCARNAQTGTCGGACPPDLTCMASSTGQGCTCLPAPCGWDSQGNCTGECFTGGTCNKDATGACNCGR